MGVVVGGVAASVHAAYQRVAQTLPVSLAAVYANVRRLAAWRVETGPAGGHPAQGRVPRIFTLVLVSPGAGKATPASLTAGI
jgi:hypothetical protein